jgi:hypothetical protein
MPRKKDTMFVISHGENRQRVIDAMEIGATVSMSVRLDTIMGLPEDAIANHMHMLRGNLDQQARRSRRKFPEKQFIVEGGSFIVTRSSAIMLVAVCTRLL